MPRMIRFACSVLMFATFAFIPTHTGQTAGFTAANAAELVAAINTANGNGQADTITLSADITLTAVDNGTDGSNGLPSVTSEITIEGAGFTITRDGGAPDFRIVHVGATGDLTLNNLTLSNGSMTQPLCGGGIYIKLGTLTLNNSVLSGNSSSNDGGGLCNDDGTVILSNSTVSGNTAIDGSGGGILNFGGTVTLNDNSVISGNSALNVTTGSGGGILNMDMLTMTNSTVSGNNATLDGGGIFNLAVAEITNSTVTGNTTGNDGGGLWIGGIATINNSTFTSNTASNFGGGIANFADLTVTSTTISDNDGLLGGGVFNFLGATAILTNSTVSDNDATDEGGGIANAGDLTVNFSTFSGNTAVDDGGGIFNGSTLNVTGSTFTGNSTLDDGGGIHHYLGTATINDSTFSGNSVVEEGGGMAVWGGTANIGNSTFSGNSGTYGGGIFVQSGTLNMNNSTLSGNVATGTGGGVWTNGATTLTNSIIANSTGEDCVEDLGSFSGADNLAGDDCAAISGGMVTNLDPVLADNGGPTLTHALLEGSNAIDASGAGATTTDQRGVAANGVRDIGAYEVNVVFVTFNEQVLQNQLQDQIATNPVVEEIEVVVVDFVPGALNFTIRTIDGTEGDVVVTVTDTDSGFVTLVISSLTVRGAGPLETYRAAINQELMPILVDSLDQILYETPWLDLDSMSITDSVIHAEVAQ